MPDEFIYFGILHCIAVSSVLALPFLRFQVCTVLLASAFCFVAPFLFASPNFNVPWLRWLGLMTYFPRTMDYVPLLPWFGAVLAGIAVVRLWVSLPNAVKLSEWKPAHRSVRVVCWGGRHSLIIYLLHQPVFLAALYPVALFATR